MRLVLVREAVPVSFGVDVMFWKTESTAAGCWS
jgi:hypothetical protein